MHCVAHVCMSRVQTDGPFTFVWRPLMTTLTFMCSGGSIYGIWVAPAWFCVCLRVCRRGNHDTIRKLHEPIAEHMVRPQNTNSAMTIFRNVNS